MEARDLFKAISERLGESADVKTVYGEPVSAEGKTLIPLAKVAYGFGGGLGTEIEKGEHEEGVGGGGGVAVKPIGVLEVTDKSTKYIPFAQNSKIAGAALLGVAAGLILSRWRGHRHSH